MEGEIEAEAGKGKGSLRSYTFEREAGRKATRIRINYRMGFRYFWLQQDVQLAPMH